MLLNNQEITEESKDEGVGEERGERGGRGSGGGERRERREWGRRGPVQDTLRFVYIEE